MAEYSNLINPDQQFIETDPNEYEAVTSANRALEAQQQQQMADQEASNGEQPEEPAEGERDVNRSYSDNETVAGMQKLADGAMDNPIAGTVLGIGAGTVDAATDLLALTQVPWLQELDESYDENFGRNRNDGWSKAVRDISAWVVPSFTGVGLLSKVGKLGKVGQIVNQGSKLDKLAKFTAFEGLTVGFEALSDQSSEAGNLGSLIESGGNFLGMDVSIPWATRDGMEPDVIKRLNILESVGMVGVGSLIDGLRALGKGVKFKPKNSQAKQMLDARAAEVGAVDPEDSIDVAEAVAANTANKVSAEQTRQGMKAMQADPEGLEYNAFKNEPHEPQARGVVNVDADPIGWKVTNAQILDNNGTIDGRHKSAYTQHFKEDYIGATEGTEKLQKLDALAEGIEGPSFSTTVGSKTYTPEQFKKFEDQFMADVHNLDVEDFRKRIDRVKETRKILGNEVKVMSRDEFSAAVGAFSRLVEETDLSRFKARAIIKNQAAGEIADVSQGIDLVGDAVDTTRQKSMVFENLQLLAQEIRTVQYLDGWSLNADKLAKTMSPKRYAEWMSETGREFDAKLLKEREKGIQFIKELVEIDKTNPEYLKPLMREYARSNGNIDTIHKLTKFAENNIGVFKKAIIDGNPEIPSQTLKQLQSIRYNNLLFGMAPIRALAGAATGLIGKPATMLLGAKVRGEQADLARTMWSYGGVFENLQRGFTVMKRDFQDAVRNPNRSSGRTDLDDVRGLQHIETMDFMAEKWVKEAPGGISGKAAIWNMTKAFAGYNTNPLVRFGINSMQGIDGFVRSMTASMASRSKAYDELYIKYNGATDSKEFLEDFNTKQKEIYAKAFDKEGVLTDDVAKYAAEEMNLQLDSKVVADLENTMRNFPILKSIMMFPKTGVNALQLGMTFNPAGVVGVRMGKAKRVFSATTADEIAEVLAEHGLSGQGETAFNALKSEYMGRELTGTGVTMMALMLAFNGDLTGSGPQDQAERQRMINAGTFKPYSIRIGGEWRKYQGLEPFDTWLGLAGDMVYKLQRTDQAITEDWFNALKSAISYNFTNKTFLSGIEPLVGLLNGDPGAINKLAVGQVDSLIPGTGARSILNKMASPGMKELENNFFNYLANRNRFLVGDLLVDKLDVFTGEQINYLDPLTAGVNALLPFFNTNGGQEKWRNQLLTIGWDGLQRMRTNPDTNEAFTPEEIRYINNFLGKEYKLGKRFESLLGANNWEKDMQDFKQQRGPYENAMSIDETFIHKKLNQTLDDGIRVALMALRERDSKLANTATLRGQVDQAVKRGKYKDARTISDQIKNLQDN